MTPRSGLAAVAATVVLAALACGDPEPADRTGLGKAVNQPAVGDGLPRNLGHCAGDEVVYFSCPLAGGGTLSVCGSAGIALDRGFLQLRSGELDAPDLVFPESRVSSVVRFRLAAEPSPELRFFFKGLTYALGDDGAFSGLRTFQGDTLLSDSPCTGEVTAHLDRLVGAVPVATD